MPTSTAQHDAPDAHADEGMLWVTERLDALARAVDLAARSADPIAALAPHRPSVAELGGVARIDAAPPIGAVLDVVHRLSRATGPEAPAPALVQPTLELAGRALQEGAAALRVGRVPSVDGATVLALAALVRAARPAVTSAPAAQPIGALVGSGAPPAPRPAAIERFRTEAVGAAERLRAALARVRAARDPIASDEAAWEAMGFAAHLASHAAEYGLSAVTDCLETARRGLATLDPRALWVLDEAGMELAEPGTPAEAVLPRFQALRARLDGVQPPPSVRASAAAQPLAAQPLAAQPLAAQPPAAQPPATTQGATLTALLRDGIAAFTAPGGSSLTDAIGAPHTVPRGDAHATAADPSRRDAPATLPDAAALAYRGPSARAAARALRDAIERGERAATPATLDELDDLLRLAEE